MARRKKGVPLDGVLVVDKPQDWTSNAVLQKVKYALNAQKAGHTGALDPLATGVLPLCFGEATKFSQLLLDSDKEYVTCAYLGRTTTTSDAEGEIISDSPVPDLSISELENILEQFRGSLKQIPSMYSALKHKGTPLYKLARQGIEVEREARDIVIHELELLEYTQPYLRLRVLCSKGTYIRNLVEDIGEVIGCGAHVTELRRTRCGPFTLEDGVSFAPFEDESGRQVAAEEYQQRLLSVDSSVRQFPEILLDEANTGSIIQGQTVKISPLSSEGRVRLYSYGRRFIGLGEVMSDGTLKPVRLLNVSALSAE
ncbi:tRNA pseudouridine(55) synthase TruB [Hahella sp. KA22]|uniref:tRNA pseudouridine(55) synthase TruB n=1 Tax=Hahella sp. KA22 TaxID=1628392 RepID=UPI000FDD5DAF|nr:tRNA pseudouridine(55) synthase TruB [Hahella sp. KA22]AZZ94198.1 tRNA pseudouridine(55) synthase TruB [Hahella sp. KA22]QAY57572.1 tRNA pseudouridine(55) synthase TruB [Hahella sp. KA22]